MEFLTAFKDFGFPAVMSIGLLVVLTRNVDAVKAEIVAVRERLVAIEAKLDSLGRNMK